jgi:hypothetical protein
LIFGTHLADHVFAVVPRLFVVHLHQAVWSHRPAAV